MQIFEGDTESHVDPRLCLDRLLENRLDCGLRHAHRRLNRLRAVIALPNELHRVVDARIPKPMEFVPRQGRNPGDVEIARWRDRNFAEKAGESELPE